ncbi:E3 ubiquitin-protein ligase EL5 [Brachypodium distachyon]|uniref:RING-type domain-containing protein n=1 Tax=Brachypodium distachyon TaxID=15368 RepID=A0A0Q3I9M6_BRADI|nr:E3 ubiquitin-protein ligase EL5 [Brachypodium distachyon]KQJ82824.1 hypothetical protein BRADI_5g11220v3 [Brachypodium distachyon]|eukprot:XP_003579835.1 E3 ubiquitin-protein ligase EL5 [Brachypodium distachyon]
MSSLPGDVLASARTTPTTVVDGDVVFSGVALLFVALGLAFVLYHYVTVHRLQGARQQGAVGAGAAAAASGVVQGVVDQVALRASLPVTLHNAKDLAGQEMEECAVCLGELWDGEAARFLPKCGHGFHAECVDLWLRSHPTCPLCRVDVGKPDALPPPLALPPVLPEPANYGGAIRLPANLLFFGSSQDDVATSARTVGGPSSSGGTEVVVNVIEVPETDSLALAPREGDAAKSRGLARVRSIRRLWSRGRREVGASTSSSTSSCHQASSSTHAEGGTTGVAGANFEP